MKRSIILSLVILSALAFMPSSELTPKQILEKAEEKLRGGDYATTELSIDIVRPKWTRTMELKSWAKGTDYSMILITAPARDKGTVFLKVDKQVWNYIPKFDRITKLPPTAMSQSWMGTDLTNDDLVRESNKVEDFTYKKLNDTLVGGLKCYQLELIPNETANVVWGKMRLCIDQQDFIQMRSEMYDEDGVLVNVMNGSNIKTMSGVKMATTLEMIPVEKPGSKTVMNMKSLDTKTPIPDDFFSKQNMKRVK